MSAPSEFKLIIRFLVSLNSPDKDLFEEAKKEKNIIRKNISLENDIILIKNFTRTSN